LLHYISEIHPIYPRQSYSRFSKSKMAPQPSCILVRWHFWHRVPIYGAILYLHTKSEPNPSILGKGKAFFPKSKMAAVRHFGIVMTSFKTIHVEYLLMSWVR